MSKIEDWMGVVRDGFEECMMAVSDLEEFSYSKIEKKVIENVCGPVLQVKFGGDVSIQLGMTTDPKTNQYISELLEDDDDDDFLPDSDTSDAVGEILNIYAGYFAKNAFKNGESVTMTTPVFIYGPLNLTNLQEFAHQTVVFDGHRLQLYVGVVKS